MAIVADKNIGFKGTINTADWALLSPLMGVRYAASDGGLLAKAGTGDRVVKVTAGWAWGHGVRSSFFSDTDDVALAGAPVASGSRWDTLAVKRTFTPQTTPTGTAELVLRTGSANKTVANPGEEGETTLFQPLWLVRFQAGSSVAQEFVDLRTFVGDGGGMVANDATVMQYMSEIGTTLRIGDDVWVSVLDGNGVGVWVPQRVPASRVKLSGDVADLQTWVNVLENAQIRELLPYLEQNARRRTTAATATVDLNSTRPGTFDTGTISFGVTYSSPPAVVVDDYIAPTGQVVSAAAVVVTKTGFQIRTTRPSGFNPGATSFSWSASGVLA